MKVYGVGIDYKVVLAHQVLHQIGELSITKLSLGIRKPEFGLCMYVCYFLVVNESEKFIAHIWLYIYVCVLYNSRRWHPTSVERKLARSETIFWYWLPIVGVEIVEFQCSLQNCRNIIECDCFFRTAQSELQIYGFGFSLVDSML